MRRLSAFLIVMCAAAAPSLAAMQTDVGTLTCTLAEHGETDIKPDSQSRLMHCAFKPKGGPEEIYVGEIKKVGAQDELSGKRVLIWAVIGPSDGKLGPAILQQTYVGEDPADAPDKAQPPKMLVGDRDRSYGLQAITDDAHEPNPSRSVTVVELRIKSTPT